MAYLRRKHEKLDEKIDESYKLLQNDFSMLIDDMCHSPRFPENAEESLYEFQREPSVIVKDGQKEKWYLTKRGIMYVAEKQLVGEGKPTLTRNIINAKETALFLIKTGNFETGCTNLQKIIDKHKIEIDWKKYEKKIW